MPNVINPNLEIIESVRTSKVILTYQICFRPIEIEFKHSWQEQVLLTNADTHRSIKNLKTDSIIATARNGGCTEFYRIERDLLNNLLNVQFLYATFLYYPLSTRGASATSNLISDRF